MSSGEIIVWAVALGVPLVVLLWVAMMYNALVRVRNAVKESWSGIDTELRRRYDLIPNLVETVRGYAAHERETLDSVTQARSAAVANHDSPESQAKDENTLIGAMRRLFAVAEQYPALQASANFLELQRELANTEDRLQRSRRFYNANVRDLNNRIEQFPSNLIAGVFGFVKGEYFEIDDIAARQPVAVRFS